MKLDIIVPLYNEEKNIEKLYNKTKEALGDIKHNFIFVDDGSSDNSLEELKKLYNREKSCVKIISFSRNFGKDAAMYAGLKNSKGDYACIIDADLQQNPKYLVRMFEFLENNMDYDCITMVQKQKNKRFLHKMFYKFIKSLSGMHFENGASDFRMFRKTVTKSLIELNEKNRFTKGIFSYIGYNTYYEEYKVEKRKEGKSKFNRSKQFKYAFEGIIAFSTKPLRISTYLGIFTSFIAIAYLIFIVIRTLVLGIEVPGYASILCAVLLLGGVQLLCIGIASEYIGKMYNEVKERPVYIAKERIGFDETIL